MIWVTGDVHGEIDFNKFIEFNEKHLNKLSKKDFVIILGDLGLYLIDDEEEFNLRKTLNDMPWTTLWLDGNHENFTLINTKFKDTEMFGGIVGIDKKFPKLIHLKRGEIYTINKKKYFIMGGGNSFDKNTRLEHISWWSREMPSFKEYQTALQNLEKNNWKVDFILSHTTATSVKQKIVKYLDKEELQLNSFLEEVLNKATWKKHFFGHFHVNMELDKNIFCLYDMFMKI